ncbi:MAG: class I SAM-dependent methyltransferase [Gemmatales bacterium]|nr:class I SAM-dependent methyltransferase [Gemmatales bacterium]MDW8388031.1 class I SAM-dependent methyltransferase [Gemmatales bacterium]
MARAGWHLYDAYALGIQSGNITFWTAMVNEVIPPHTGQEVVLDYGCGDGQFLRLLYSMRPFSYGLGVDVNPVLLEKARRNRRENEPIEYATPASLDGIERKFDLVFSQEIFWMIADLEALAKTIYRVIKDKGEYYATMGCHIENPLWPHRRRLLTREGFCVFDYSLDEVADVFYRAGFEVGLKRLPVEYFNIYHPEFTPQRAQSLSRLVQTTHDHKMLFYFRRDEEWRREQEQKHQQ